MNIGNIFSLFCGECNSDCINESENPVQSENPVNIQNVKNVLNENIQEFIDILEEYHNICNNPDIRALPREERKHATLMSAMRVVESAEKLIIVLRWLSDPDILSGMRTYYPRITMSCHMYIIKLVYDVDRIREKYEKTNPTFSNKTSFVVTIYIYLLKSFGPHILWFSEEK